MFSTAPLLSFGILYLFFATLPLISGQYANLTIRFEPEVLRPENHVEGFLVKCTESVNPTPKEYMVTFYLNGTVLTVFTINPAKDRFAVDVHSHPALNVYPTRESLYEIRVRPNDPIEQLGTFQCSFTCNSINFPHPLTFYSNIIDTQSTLVRTGAIIPKANIRLDVNKVDSGGLVTCHVHLEPPHLNKKVIFLMDNTAQAEYSITYSKKRPLVYWKRLVDLDSYNVYRGNSTLFSDTDFQLSMLFLSTLSPAPGGGPRTWWKCQLVVMPSADSQETAKFFSNGVDFKH